MSNMKTLVQSVFFLLTYIPGNYYTRLTALIRDYPGEPVPEMQNQSGFY